MGRICKNKVTDHIRAHFGANPLKTPETRIQPLCVLEVVNGRSKYLGEFKYLTKEPFSHDIPINIGVVADVSDQKTRKAEFDIGFDILGSYLKVLGVDPASIGAGFKKSKKMAFSFSNVRRKFIDGLQFGQILSHNDILGDRDNFMLHNAFKDEAIQLAIITDVIVSNNFSVSTYSKSEEAVDIDVPAIANAIAGLGLEVKLEQTGDNEVKFEGPDDLTFAFGALEIKIDPATGKFSRGDWLSNLKSIGPQPRSIETVLPDEMQLINRFLIDENTDYPLLIEL